VVGVAWHVKLLPLKLFPSSGHRDPGAGLDADIAKAFDYAVGHGAKIINASWAGPNWSLAVKEAVSRAQQADVLLVAAAANDNGNDNDLHPRYPASYGNDNIISVLSIDENDQLSSFSNFGQHSVQLGAPGRGIESTVPHSSYSTLSGTSQATPFVAGAVALVWSLPEFKGKSGQEVKNAILTHARKVPNLISLCVTGAVLDLSYFKDAPAAGGVATQSMQPTLTVSYQGIARVHIDATGTKMSVGGQVIADPRLMSILPSMDGEEVTVRGLSPN
jgi:subtilisin family serine protease